MFDTRVELLLETASARLAAVTFSWANPSVFLRQVRYLKRLFNGSTVHSQDG